MGLIKWLQTYNIDFEQQGSVYVIDGKRYLHVHRVQDFTFDDQFEIQFTEKTIKDLESCDYYMFLFGTKYYYSRKEYFQIQPLKYIGMSIGASEELYAFLGVHGKYEILNGTRSYQDWCKKAKFSGYKSLGIAEHNTLAGVIEFQGACEQYGLKSIIGMQATVMGAKNIKYDVKLYCKSKVGWKNLLSIHRSIEENAGYINEGDFFKLMDGLFIVVCTDTDLSNLFILSSMTDVYYQVDFAEFKSNSTDLKRLNYLKAYFDKHMDEFKPVVIQDAFYLDKEDSFTKILVNEIGGSGFYNLSKNQYLKSFQELFIECAPLFKNKELLMQLFSDGIKNTNDICDNCNYTIVKEQSYLPKYIFSEQEKQLASSSSDLFMHYVMEGFQRKVSAMGLDEAVYMKRVEKEAMVLSKGNVIDYFLILKDIILYCKGKKILTGIGRGSAAGSLIAYLLDIVEVDPIAYGLLFERFLNEARLMKGTLPDIDQDVPSAHRQEIIDHIFSKYGENNVAFIGTNQALKLRSLCKDLFKYGGEKFKDANYLTAMIPSDAGNGIQALFKAAASAPKLKKAINKHHKLIEMIEQLELQPRSFGIHAAGIVIVPSEDAKGNPTTVYDYLPVRKVDGHNVTEWEKDTLEGHGFLKLDLLGLNQLDKIMNIKSLVKQSKGIDLNMLDIPLNDKKVFSLFHKGFNEDIFQLSGAGLKDYCMQLKPNTIEDIIATVSLYRPGAMGSGSHLRYIKVKNGDEAPNYYPKSESILNETHSVLCYQEQVMKICTDLAGFTLGDADDMRKAIGKKSIDLLMKYKNQFIDGIMSSSQYTEEQASTLWTDIEYFGEYAFNKSHAACYGITGYYTQWLKSYYPLEFYTTALQYASDRNLSSIIDEISVNAHMKLMPPDINKSGDSYYTDFDNNTIYWSLSSIKYVGVKKVDLVVQERKKGLFYSLNDFVSRVKIDKRTLTNLILCGAFDEVENVGTKYSNRASLLHATMHSDDYTDFMNGSGLCSNTAFAIKQKDLCGYAIIDYAGLGGALSNPMQINSITKKHIGKIASVIGIVRETRVFNTKVGEICKITVEQNSNKIEAIIWNDFLSPNKDKILSAKGKLVNFQGVLRKDFRSDNVQIQSYKQSKLIIK